MVQRHYPQQPVLSAGAIVFRGNEVLLIKRGREPAKGLWSIPGGVINVGERILEGLAREVLEETGIEAGFGGLVEIVERIFHDDQGRIAYHYVILDYQAEFISGRVNAASDVDDARFIPVADIERVPLTEGLGDVIRKAFAFRCASG